MNSLRSSNQPRTSSLAASICALLGLLSPARAACISGQGSFRCGTTQQLVYQDAPCGDAAKIGVQLGSFTTLGSGGGVKLTEVSSGLWDITVDLGSGASTPIDLKMVAFIPNQSIRTILVCGPGSSAPKDAVVSISTVSGNPQFVNVATATGGSVSSTGLNKLIVTGNVAGNLGSVSASYMGGYASYNGINMVVSGNLVGPINLSDAGGINAPTLSRLDVTGDVLGNITAAGTIADLRVTGSLGTSSVAPTISAANITSITAGAVNATIRAGSGASGTLQRLFVRSAIGTGTFTGLLDIAAIGSVPFDTEGTADTFSTGITIDGDLGAPNRSGQITIRSTPLTNNSSPYDSRLVIGGKLAANATIQLPANGLQGQIILNQRNLLSSPTAAWQAGAIVKTGSGSGGSGSETLTNPAYITVPSAVGGGLVGTAKYGFHGPASAPPHASTLLFSPPNSVYAGPDCETYHDPNSGPAFVTVRHYGPVALTGTSLPYTIQRRRPGTATWSTWTPATGSFSASVTGNDTDPDRNCRVRITGQNGARFYAGWEYRVTPIVSGFQCEQVSGTPAISDFEYTFSVRWDCEAGMMRVFDLNGDSTLNTGDASTWAAQPVDLDQNGAVASPDLTLLLQAVDTYQNNPPQ